MSKLKRTNLFSTFLLTITVFFALGAIVISPAKAADASETDQDKVVLKVNDKTVTKGEFDAKFKARWNRMGQRLQKLPERRKQMIKKRMRQSLKEQFVQRLVLKDAVKNSNIEVAESKINSFYDKQFSTEQKKQQAMQRFGVDEAGLKDKVREMLKIQQFIKNRVGELEVTEEEMRKFYEENKKQYEEPGKVKARHILIKNDQRSDTEARELARQVKSNLESGEDFCEQAEEHSEGPSASDCGDLGFFARKRMAQPFSQAAFALGTNELSDPVKTQFGYHVIEKLDEKSGKTSDFSEAKSRVREQLKQQKRKEKSQEVISKLVKEADIERNFPQSSRKQSKPRGGRSIPVQPGN